MPHYVRGIFAIPEMTGRIQNEPDPIARVIGRCFASFIAKKLSSDAKACSGANVRFSDAELAAILRSRSPSGGLQQLGVIGLANTISLLSGEIDTLLDGKVPHVQKQIAQETVVILGTQVLNAERNAGTGSGGTIPRDYDPIRVTVVGLTRRWRGKAA